jgi:hypothetical protein
MPGGSPRDTCCPSLGRMLAVERIEVLCGGGDIDAMQLSAGAA